MKNLRVKKVFRHDEIQGHFCLFRIMWEKGVVGDGVGCSNMLSVALQRSIFKFDRAGRSWILVLAGVRLHRKVSMGGVFA